MIQSRPRCLKRPVLGSLEVRMDVTRVALSVPRGTAAPVAGDEPTAMILALGDPSLAVRFARSPSEGDNRHFGHEPIFSLTLSPFNGPARLFDALLDEGEREEVREGDHQPH